MNTEPAMADPSLEKFTSLRPGMVVEVVNGCKFETGSVLITFRVLFTFGLTFATGSAAAELSVEGFISLRSEIVAEAVDDCLVEADLVLIGFWALFPFGFVLVGSSSLLPSEVALARGAFLTLFSAGWALVKIDFSVGFLILVDCVSVGASLFPVLVGAIFTHGLWESVFNFGIVVFKVCQCLSLRRYLSTSEKIQDQKCGFGKEEPKSKDGS